MLAACLDEGVPGARAARDLERGRGARPRALALRRRARRARPRDRARRSRRSSARERSASASPPARTTRSRSTRSCTAASPAPFTAVPGAARHRGAQRARARGPLRAHEALVRRARRACATATRCCAAAARSGAAAGRSSSRASRRRSPRRRAGRIAIPGRDTTAYLLLRLAAPALGEVVELRYDEILDAVAERRRSTPGLIIHESRFTYADARARRGRRPGRLVGGRDRHARAARRGSARARDLDAELRAAAEDAIRRSVEHAFAHPLDSLEYVRAHSQELSDEVCRQHIELYVNEFTRDLGDDGMAAIDALLARAAGLPRDQRALARGGRRLRACPAGACGRCTTPTASRASRARCCSCSASASAEALPADVLPELDDAPPRVVAVLVDALGWAFVERFARALAAARAPARRGRRLEVDDAISLDDDGARDDAAHRAARRRARLVRVVHLRAVARPPRLPADGRLRRRAAGGLVAAGADLGAIYPQADGLAARLARLGATLPPRAAGRDRRDALHALVCAGATRARRRERARGRGARGAARAGRGAVADAALPRRLRHERRTSSGPTIRAPRRSRSSCSTRSSTSSWTRSPARPGALVLLFADHGQLPTDPERCVYVNERCPQLVPLLRRGADGRPLAPAGSARDLFLHVREGALDEAVGLLEELFGDDAWVVPTARARGRRRLRAAHLGALPRAGRRHRRAAARRRRGLVARAGPLRAGQARPPRRPRARGGRDLARRARPVTRAAAARRDPPAALPALGRGRRRERPHAERAADLEQVLRGGVPTWFVNPNRPDRARARVLPRR